PSGDPDERRRSRCHRGVANHITRGEVRPSPRAPSRWLPTIQPTRGTPAEIARPLRGRRPRMRGYDHAGRPPSSPRPSRNGAPRRVGDQRGRRDRLERDAELGPPRLRRRAARTAGGDLSADVVEELLVRVESGELGDPLPVLAYLAGQGVELGDDEL